jgi:hypothetical protein
MMVACVDEGLLDLHHVLLVVRSDLSDELVVVWKMDSVVEVRDRGNLGGSGDDLVMDRDQSEAVNEVVSDDISPLQRLSYDGGYAVEPAAQLG